MDIKKEINRYLHELIELRRDFHKHPELGFEEFRTSKIIYDYLIDIGLEVKKIAKTGVVGLLKGNNPGPTLLLRADMDGLPIEDEKNVSYKSVYQGKMHACAHDGHMAMLLITAKILTKYKDLLHGNIKFVFQPNEEDAGARKMIEEGVMNDPNVDFALGIHLWSPLKTGTIGISAGPVMAGHDNFKIELTGKGGHTAIPENAIDPIIAAANIVQSVQSIQTREVSPLKPTLIMFGRINGGTGPNIIPEKIEIEGSIRYLHEDNEDESIKDKFKRIVDSLCSVYRVSYKLDFVPSSALLANDVKLTEVVKNIAENVVGKENIVPFVSMAGEDFSEFSKEVPSVFYFIGTGNEAKRTTYSHHHPLFDIDEDSLPLGVEMHIRTSLSILGK